MAKQFPKTKFPETMYVKEEADGDSRYFITSDDPSDLVEPGVAVAAAEYKLVRAGVVIESKVSVR